MQTLIVSLLTSFEPVFCSPSPSLVIQSQWESHLHKEVLLCVSAEDQRLQAVSLRFHSVCSCMATSDGRISISRHGEVSYTQKVKITNTNYPNQHFQILYRLYWAIHQPTKHFCVKLCRLVHWMSARVGLLHEAGYPQCIDGLLWVVGLGDWKYPFRLVLFDTQTVTKNKTLRFVCVGFGPNCREFWFYAGKNNNKTHMKHISVITRGRTITKGDSVQQAKERKPITISQQFRDTGDKISVTNSKCKLETQTFNFNFWWITEFKFSLHVWILIFVMSGLFGEVELAAQHVLVEIGTIIYMVWIICVHINIQANMLPSQSKHKKWHDFDLFTIL